MKKLLVLAALSAMVMGAKAEYTTWTITDSGLSAVYGLSDLSVSDMEGKNPQEWAGLVWSRPFSADDESFSDDKYFLNAEIATLVTGKETWAERYAVLEQVLSGGKFAEKGGTFSYSRSQGGSAYWTLFALNLKTAVEFPSGTTKNAKIRRDEGNGEIDC